MHARNSQGIRMMHVHCVLHAKGGVGKSLVASLLAQYLGRNGSAPLCIDADPLHATLAGYTGLAVRRLPWHASNALDARAFDTLLQWIAQAAQDVVLDTSASIHLPLLHYLASARARPRLARIRHGWVVHSVVPGGPALLDSVNGLAPLLAQWPEATRCVLWLNPYWGALAHAGQGMEALPAYRAQRQRIAALLRLPALQEQTDGRALAAMLAQRLTFAQALATPAMGILERQRLRQLQRALFAQLDLAMVL